MLLHEQVQPASTSRALPLCCQTNVLLAQAAPAAGTSAAGVVLVALGGVNHVIIFTCTLCGPSGLAASVCASRYRVCACSCSQPERSSGGMYSVLQAEMTGAWQAMQTGIITLTVILNTMDANDTVWFSGAHELVDCCSYTAAAALSQQMHLLLMWSTTQCIMTICTYRLGVQS